jgi:hypothetical protein
MRVRVKRVMGEKERKERRAVKVKVDLGKAPPVAEIENVARELAIRELNTSVIGTSQIPQTKMPTLINLTPENDRRRRSLRQSIVLSGTPHLPIFLSARLPGTVDQIRQLSSKISTLMRYDAHYHECAWFMQEKYNHLPP